MTRTEAFKAGWKACEAGKSLIDNPFRNGGTQVQQIDWHLGFEARGEKSFDVSHLPRKPFSDAFA